MCGSRKTAVSHIPTLAARAHRIELIQSSLVRLRPSRLRRASYIAHRARGRHPRARLHCDDAHRRCRDAQRALGGGNRLLMWFYPRASTGDGGEAFEALKELTRRRRLPWWG